MLPHTHFIFGILIGLIGLKYNIISTYDVFIIGFLTVFIDIDHYLTYIIHRKNYNVLSFWNDCTDHYRQKHFSHRTFIHHMPGMLIISLILFIIGVFNNRVGFILITAYISHMLLDHLSYLNKNIFRYKVNQKITIAHFIIPINYAEELMFGFGVIVSVLMIV